MEYETTLALQAFALAERWDASRSSEDLSQFKGSDLESFSSNQKGDAAHSMTFRSFDHFNYLKLCSSNVCELIPRFPLHISSI
jgi:hypothetical protein